MTEKLRQKLIKEKVMYLMKLDQRIELLEQKEKDNIITSSELNELKGIKTLRYIHEQKLKKLYED